MKYHSLIAFLLLTFVGLSQKEDFQSDELLSLNHNSPIIDLELVDEEVYALSKSENGYEIIAIDSRGDHRVLNVKSKEQLSLARNCVNKVFILTSDSAYSTSSQKGTSRIEFELDRERCMQNAGELQAARLSSSYFILPLLNDTVLVDFYNGRTERMRNPGQTTTHNRSMVNNRAYPNARGYQGGQVYDVDSTGRHMVDREPAYQRRMENTRKSQYDRNGRVSHVANQPFFFLINDKIVAVSPTLDNIFHLNEKGAIIDQKELQIERPLLWSNAKEELFIRQDRLFVKSVNSAGTQFYEIDPESGHSKLLFKMDRNWVLGDFEVNAYNLTYHAVGVESQKIFIVDLFDYTIN